MQAQSIRLLIHDPGALNPSELFDRLVQLDKLAGIKRSWPSVMQHLEERAPQNTDLVIDILEGDGQTALARANDIWQLRRKFNYSPTPLYFVISSRVQSPQVRFSIRHLSGHFITMDHVPDRFQEEVDEIIVELAELKLNLPKWEIIEEGELPNLRAYVHLRFRGQRKRVKGSDLESAALSAMIRHNGMARNVNAWCELFANNRLFAPSGGLFSVPNPRVLKAYVDERFERYLQATFDEVRSGYSARRVIEHLSLGSKAVAYRIRGRVST